MNISSSGSQLLPATNTLPEDLNCSTTGNTFACCLICSTRSNRVSPTMLTSVIFSFASRSLLTWFCTKKWVKQRSTRPYSEPYQRKKTCPGRKMLDTE